MQYRQFILSRASVTAFVLLTAVTNVWAEEQIIQQEDLSYEKCLKVITASADKLSIAPEIEDLSDQKRLAVFSLVDGTLTITCDGLKSKLIVSTNVN